MDFLARLKMLMEKSGDNNSTLAKKSGIPYTTIDGLFKRGWEKAQISTIQKICQHYGVSIDYMVYGSGALSEDTLLMAAKYESLDQHGRDLVDAIINVEGQYQANSDRVVAKVVPTIESVTGVKVGHSADAQAQYNAAQELKELYAEDLAQKPSRLMR